MSTIKENLIDLFDLDKMSSEKSAEMVDRLAKIVFQSTLVRVLPLLSEEDLTKYEKLVDEKQGGEEVFKFLSEKISNFDQIIAEESENLRAEMAGEFKSAGI